MEKRPDVQNIDLMNLAGFCRNCLSRWYQEAANDRGIEMTKDEGREIFYGMPYADWVAQHQTEASDDKKAAFEKSFARERRTAQELTPAAATPALIRGPDELSAPTPQSSPLPRT